MSKLSRGSRPPDGGNPWKVRASRDVYANAWISVCEDDVVRPDGSDGIYGVVSFNSLALGAVPLFDDGDTVLVGQFRYPTQQWSWEIPEGGGALDVDPVEEMARELREEAGLVGRTWTPLGRVDPSNSVTDQRGLLWLVENLGEAPSDPDPTEALTLWRLPFRDAHAMALDGRLTDALTVVGLCRAAAELQRRET